MLDNINAQLKRKEIFAKKNFYLYQRNADATQLTYDFSPMTMEYFHELNPTFIYYLRPENLDFLPAITVRDGSIVLGAFILKYFQNIPSYKTHFFIAKPLAHLIPVSLRSHFSAWTIQQEKQIKPKDARTIFISGIASDLSIDPNDIKAKLELLKDLPTDCKIELFLPQRRSPFGVPWKDSYLTHEVIEMIKDHLPGKKLHNIKLGEILERTNWKDIYALDLMDDSLVLGDSYLNHYIAARGGTVSAFSARSDESKQFELDLSLNHKIQFSPLPEVNDIFTELIFYKKQNPGRDPVSDPHFHLLLKKKNF